MLNFHEVPTKAWHEPRFCDICTRNANLKCDETLKVAFSYLPAMISQIAMASIPTDIYSIAVSFSINILMGAPCSEL